ncbi:MAG: peptidylprolyl isomerase [Proteobacteria bacterium]|nr:peptidylprolyl isomerase [Pseudomonadota bacterium]
MQIEKHTAVSIDYVLKGDDGKVIDESIGGQFNFLSGAQNIIPGLENALQGKAAGDEFDVTIAPGEAYGEVDPSRVQTVKREMFPEGVDIQVGAQFHGASPGGEPIVVTVASIEGDDIVIDGNHALAGQTLHFAVKIVEVRAATEDEVSHGHIHGEGCSH